VCRASASDRTTALPIGFAVFDFFDNGGPWLAAYGDLYLFVD
jgi:hypothetical protein